MDGVLAYWPKQYLVVVQTPVSISKISRPHSPSDIDDVNSSQKQPTLSRLLLPPHDSLERKPSTHEFE